MNDSQRDELLGRLDERTCHLMKVMTNHLSHHWAIVLLAIGAVLSGIGSLLISLFT